MRIALKLNAIEQEHLQELYNAAGVARDELPYTEQFTQLCQDFQDRTFKNAEPEQVFAALLRYTRSSTCPSGEASENTFDDEQLKHLKIVLQRQGKGGRIIPYSSEFEAAYNEFRTYVGKEVTPLQFWQAVCRTQSRSRRAPRKTVHKAAVEANDDSDDE